MSIAFKHMYYSSYYILTPISGNLLVTKHKYMQHLTTSIFIRHAIHYTHMQCLKADTSIHSLGTRCDGCHMIDTDVVVD